MKKLLLGSITLFALFCSVQAQRTCASFEYYQKMLQTNPTFAQNQRNIEKFTEDFIKKGGSSAVDDDKVAGVKYTIPVVVHVVYKTAAQNISDAQVLSQIDVLNEDFKKKNDDVDNVPNAFKDFVANCKIEFCLAKTDPNGDATTGIVRVHTNVNSFSSNNAVKFTNQGGDDAWPADDYLNLWVCNLGGGLLGYAQFPGGPDNTDGVVILYSAFGNKGNVDPPFDLGRTATHEVGHWLNLRHIWGDDGGACSGSDLVDDTPNQSNYNFSCPNFPHISCSNGPKGDMFMNYMDYVDDACMYMFTKGQKDRMFAVLKPGGARHSNTTSDACNTPFAKAAPDAQKAIKIYPQPAASSVNIQFDKAWTGKTTVTVSNQSGFTFITKQINTDSKSANLDVSKLQNGIYFIHFNNGKETVSQKLVVQH